MIVRGRYRRKLNAEIHLVIQSEKTLTVFEIDSLALSVEQYLNNLPLLKSGETPLFKSGETKTKTLIGIRVHL